MSGQRTVSRKDIVNGLRRLGLKAGARVMVHSSLSSFGRVDGGPAAVIGALMDVLTPAGTLMMPSFNHGRAFLEGAAGVYDPAATPTSNGLIPETFRKMPGVVRSLHPTHATAAWGRDAVRYVSGHHLTLTMGPDSPLGALGREGGMGLFLGTDYSTNTYKHAVETALAVPCLGRRTVERPVRLPDGRRVLLRTWGWRSRRCPINDSNDYVEREMDARGLHVRGRIGGSIATLLRYSDCFRVTAEMLTMGYAGCPPCSRCPVRPVAGPATVESDWDDEKCCLKPDSPVRELGPLWYETPARGGTARD